MQVGALACSGLLEVFRVRSALKDVNANFNVFSALKTRSAA
jgi:hypothetical protein